MSSKEQAWVHKTLLEVHDCIMVARDTADIDMAIKSLRELRMTLEEEDELAGFLGIHIERTTDHVKLTQKGLTQRIIEALQIEGLPPVSTPVDKVVTVGLQ